MQQCPNLGINVFSLFNKEVKILSQMWGLFIFFFFAWASHMMLVTCKMHETLTTQGRQVMLVGLICKVLLLFFFLKVIKWIKACHLPENWLQTEADMMMYVTDLSIFPGELSAVIRYHNGIMLTGEPAPVESSSRARGVLPGKKQSLEELLSLCIPLFVQQQLQEG